MRPVFVQSYALRGSDVASAKLAEDQIPIIRRRFDSGERLAAIASDYGVSEATILCVGRRRTWNHVRETEDSKWPLR